MDTKPVTIRVREVGQAFGCEGEVWRGRTLLYTTPLFPSGFDRSAFLAASSWVTAMGYQRTVGV